MVDQLSAKIVESPRAITSYATAERFIACIIVAFAVVVDKSELKTVIAVHINMTASRGIFTVLHIWLVDFVGFPKVCVAQ